MFRCKVCGWIHDGDSPPDVCVSCGSTADRFRPMDEAEVDAAIDSWVWYAGWADKLAQVLGSSNPVSGPYFNFTVPEPTGVVAVLAPDEPPLLGLVSRVLPALTGGNAVIAVASETRPLIGSDVGRPARRVSSTTT